MAAPLTRFGFLTLRHFSMIAFTNALEPLRMANYLARDTLYHWSVYSLDGSPAEASNGLAISPTRRATTSAHRCRGPTTAANGAIPGCLSPT